MIKNYILKVLNKLVVAERSVTILTSSFCLGAALAFSPYVGLQTWMVFPLCWLFGLNIAVTMVALYLISNPFTMVPIICGEYFFGSWLIHYFNLEFLKHNPAIIVSVAAFFKKYLFDIGKILGPDWSFWSFFIGAHIISILIFVVLYPIMKRVFTLFIARTPHN